MTSQPIIIGSKVRSFDYPDMYRELTGPDAFYIEGVVLSISDWEGCPRYDIQVTRKVSAGQDRPVKEGRMAHPPVNGTPTTMGGVCNGVEEI